MLSDVPYYVDDLTLAPVIVRQHKRKPSNAEFEESLASMKERFEAAGRFGFVLSFDRGMSITQAQRRILAQWLDDNRRLLETESYGTGLVTSNAALRFIWASVLLITTPPGRTKTCGSVEHAIRYVVAGIVELNDDLPPSLRPYLAAA